MIVPFPIGRATWLLRPLLVEPNVQRISLAWFVQMGAALQPLARNMPSDGHARGELLASAVNLRSFLEALLHSVDSGTFPLSIRTSYAALRDLLRQCSELLHSDQTTLSDDEFRRLGTQIWLKASELEMILNAELAVQPTYLISPKRAYDTEAFISDGTKLFSDVCRIDFTDDEKNDINQATKCLALEVPTAAGFHIIRATESVIRRYYYAVVGKLPATKSRNWSVYIKALKWNGADQRITAVLDEMRDLYRNPIVHPETQLTMDEALSLIGIAETAISAMIADLRKRKTAVLAHHFAVAASQSP